MEISKREYWECDICSTKVKKRDTRVQKGLRRCKSCVDDIKNEGKNTSMRWGTPRANSDTLTAVNDVTVFNITAAGGITPSHSISSEVNRAFFMVVQGSGGAVTITANPQIVIGSNHDILSLKGNSATNTLTLSDGSGIVLTGGVGFTLGKDDTIGFSCDGVRWIETSRHEN